ncbi:MAG TPA: AzlC family ABC transporter permease [Chloroflexota bacterium]
MTTDAPPASPEAPTFTVAGARAGARRALPLAVSIYLVGTVFGVLARHAGLTLPESLLMSGFVFAGASQFIAVGLWALPVPAAAIIFTTLIVNLRHVLMGAALRSWFAGLSPRKIYGSLFFMVDESWALTIREIAAGGQDRSFLLGAGLLMYGAWLTGTTTGHLAGAAIGNLSRWGLDFAITAVFTALLVGLWRGRADLWPWAISAAVAIAAWHWLPGTWYIVLGAVAGSLVGAIVDAD